MTLIAGGFLAKDADCLSVGSGDDYVERDAGYLLLKIIKA